jgi:hypothetical protein
VVSLCNRTCIQQLSTSGACGKGALGYAKRDKLSRMRHAPRSTHTPYAHCALGRKDPMRLPVATSRCSGKRTNNKLSPICVRIGLNRLFVHVAWYASSCHADSRCEIHREATCNVNEDLEGSVCSGTCAVCSGIGGSVCSGIYTGAHMSSAAGLVRQRRCSIRREDQRDEEMCQRIDGKRRR